MNNNRSNTKKETTNLGRLFGIQRVLDSAIKGYFSSEKVIRAERELNQFGEITLYFNDKEMQVYATCKDLLVKFFDVQTNGRDED